ncbi:dTDP-4-dehydrorhamnose 3,5-epimerase [Povalibacter sp.]|uniref:dTDP-4-dehydrorhamnose 3,5-epimerase n=1 Tax=Povalibacter sp. TaxID=1962978 RepID=UPI002F3F1C33
MEFVRTQIPDVVLIKPAVHGDARGFFMETWHQRKFSEAGIPSTFVQDNHSRSARHILRGLHYQIRQPQGKLVRVVVGAVFDVAVDMRRSSPTFGHWVGAELSAENRHMLWAPAGFAHGFLVLSDVADFVYKCTDFWAPEHERSLLWNDEDLGIDWPLPISAQPRLSGKDAAAPRFRDAEYFE